MINNKEVRGKLLACLNFMFPEGVERMGLIGMHIDFYTMDDILKAVEYLMQKEYVEGKEIPHPYKQREYVVQYKITSRGIDLQEGTISDKGVLLGDY